MSATDSPAGTDVPQSVTFREVQELLRTFSRSGWRGMTLEVQGLRITVGKDGAPAGVAPTARGATAGTATASSAAPPAPVPATPPSTSDAPSPAVVAGVARGAVAPSVDTTGCVAVRSPAVGAFWTAPSPGQPPFVQVGDTVAADQQLAIVEVMKLMNPVVAATAGEVVQVCAENAAMVEYEQVLFWIRPSDG